MTIRKRMTIGIAPAIVGMALVILVPLNSQGQKPSTNIDEPVIKILPGKTYVPRTDRSKQIKAPAQPLSLADKQRILKSVFASLQQLNKDNPQLNLSSLFPTSEKDQAQYTKLITYAVSSNAPNPQLPTLTPDNPRYGKSAWLNFIDATILYDNPYYQHGVALWSPYQPDFSKPDIKPDPFTHEAPGLEVSLNSVAGTNYFLDFVLDHPNFWAVATTNPDWIVVSFAGPGGSNTFSLAPAPGFSAEGYYEGNHLLIPFKPSKTGWYTIKVSCSTGLQFSSLQWNYGGYGQ